MTAPVLSEEYTKEILDSAKWQILRSDVYLRDNGICWVCNKFVELKDYDLGHLIDKCNGGIDEYENLAVMHKRCNTSKPRHKSLDEAVRWKLATKHKPPIQRKNNRNNYKQIPIISIKTHSIPSIKPPSTISRINRDELKKLGVKQGIELGYKERGYKNGGHNYIQKACPKCGKIRWVRYYHFGKCKDTKQIFCRSCALPENLEQYSLNKSNASDNTT